MNISEAIKSTEIAMIECLKIRDAWKRGTPFYFDTPEFKEAKARTVATVGRVTVKASAAGNSRRRHIRHTFKIDGKRASREEVAAL